MKRQRGGLVPIGEVIGGLGGRFSVSFSRPHLDLQTGRPVV